ncbi:hypothetical protein FOLKNPGA_00179 [Legionella sp. PC1000]|nr:hypothetical protein FOLKNPGA_00179 [Legionella sp. PC1000]
MSTKPNNSFTEQFFIVSLIIISPPIFIFSKIYYDANTNYPYEKIGNNRKRIHV